MRSRGWAGLAASFLVAALALAWWRGGREGARLDAAVARGLAYLRRDRSDLSALVVLDYLQRRYALAGDLAFVETRGPGEDDDARLRTWGRLVGLERRLAPNALGPLAGAASVEDVVMHALYCDRVPLPPTFVDFLRAFAERGDYELTHAPLALALARDNGCPLDEAAVVALEARLRAQLRALIGRPRGDRRFEPLDVRYEALAVLEDLLSARDVPDAWLADLVSEQQPDGGWRPAPDGSSRPHPTVLAVWALLARRHPDAPRIHFARPAPPR
jgi:hypothetical protein